MRQTKDSVEPGMRTDNQWLPSQHPKHEQNVQGDSLDRKRVQELAEPLASGRIIFVQQYRPKLLAKYPDMSASDVSTLLADLWLRTTPEERYAYELEAWNLRELQWLSRHKKPPKPKRNPKPTRPRLFQPEPLPYSPESPRPERPRPPRASAHGKPGISTAASSADNSPRSRRRTGTRPTATPQKTPRQSIYDAMRAEVDAYAQDAGGDTAGLQASGSDLSEVLAMAAFRDAVSRDWASREASQMLQGGIPAAADQLQFSEMLQGALPAAADQLRTAEMLQGALPAAGLGGQDLQAAAEQPHSWESWASSSPSAERDALSPGARLSADRVKGGSDINCVLSEMPMAEMLDLRKGSTCVEQPDARFPGITVRDALVAACQDGMLLKKYPGLPGQANWLKRSAKRARRVRLLITDSCEVALEKVDASRGCSCGVLQGKRHSSVITRVQVTSRRWDPDTARIIVSMQNGQSTCYAAADTATHHTLIEALNAALLLSRGEVQATESLSMLPWSQHMVFDA